MKLGRPLLKLPRQYCAESLAKEVLALPSSAWMAHPGRLAGNDAVALITPGGAITNSFTGPMAPTQYLEACPYIQEIMADIGAVWGRSRLMGLAAGAVVPDHVDVGHYWRTHLRIHIPVITTPKVEFTCDGQTVHMAAGECWAFDSFCRHNVRNAGAEKRVHLVLDTVGGDKLWDLLAEAETAEPVFVPPGTVAATQQAYEKINTPEVMSAWEIRCHVDFLLNQQPTGAGLEATISRLNRFANGWAAAWAQYGTSDEGLPSYNALIADVRTDLAALRADRILLPNEVPLDRVLNEMIFMVAAPSIPAANGHVRLAGAGAS